jgi:hypothetical protein
MFVQAWCRHSRMVQSLVNKDGCWCCLQTTRDCLSLLKTLMSSWLLLLEQQQLAGGLLPDSCGDAATPEPGWRPRGVSSSSSSSGAALDLHRTEGVLFMLLCSYDPLVRQEALQLLGLVRTLHQQLASTGGAADAPWGSAGRHPSGAAGLSSSIDLQTGGLVAPGYTTPRGLAGQPTAAGGATPSPGGGSAAATGGTTTPLGAGSTPPSGMGGVVDGILSMAGNLVDSVASSGSSASLVAGGMGGLFTRHRATASRDSSEAPLFGEGGREGAPAVHACI